MLWKSTPKKLTHFLFITMCFGCLAITILGIIAVLTQTQQNVYKEVFFRQLETIQNNLNQTLLETDFMLQQLQALYADIRINSDTPQDIAGPYQIVKEAISLHESATLHQYLILLENGQHAHVVSQVDLNNTTAEQQEFLTNAILLFQKISQNEHLLKKLNRLLMLSSHLEIAVFLNNNLQNTDTLLQLAQHIFQGKTSPPAHKILWSSAYKEKNGEHSIMGILPLYGTHQPIFIGLAPTIELSSPLLKRLSFPANIEFYYDEQQFKVLEKLGPKNEFSSILFPLQQESWVLKLDMPDSLEELNAHYGRTFQTTWSLCAIFSLIFLWLFFLNRLVFL